MGRAQRGHLYECDPGAVDQPWSGGRHEHAGAGPAARPAPVERTLLSALLADKSVSATSEAADRFLLVLVDLEHGDELGDVQQLIQLGRQVKELELPTAVGNGRVRAGS